MDTTDRVVVEKQGDLCDLLISSRLVLATLSQVCD